MKLELKDMKHVYPTGDEALKGIDLVIEGNEPVAIIGQNGAGKTTVFNLLTKFYQPTRGQIMLLGTDITHAKPDRVARMGMVRSFQISAVFPNLTVLENIRIALQRPAALYRQFWKPVETLNALNGRADALIEEFGLVPWRDHRAAELSYGRKRVLEIATTLALDPKVLLLDEPMAGMGHEDVHMVAHIVRDLARNRAILMVEHNLSVVADICDQVTVLQRGSILASGDYATVSQNPEVRAAYMGEETDGHPS